MSISVWNAKKIEVLKKSLEEVNRYREVLLEALDAAQDDELHASRLAGRLRRRSLDLSENLVELRKS